MPADAGSHEPALTVAAIVQREDRFLVVEESIGGALVINQPAGHVEPGETPIDAVVREAREETAWEFAPERLTGIYLWKPRGAHRAYLRLAFSGRVTEHDPLQALDEGIVQALWLTEAELRHNGRRLRSPMVLRCIEDHRRGAGAPPELANESSITELTSRALRL